MTDDRIEGVVRKGVGHVQDAIGGLTGDGSTQARGKLNKAAGSAQDFVGKAQERASDVLGDLDGFVREQPLAALAVTLGAGVALGLALGGGRTAYIRR